MNIKKDLIVNYDIDLYFSSVSDDFYNLSSNKFVINVDDYEETSDKMSLYLNSPFVAVMDYDVTVDIVVNVMTRDGIRNGNIKKVKGKLRLLGSSEINLNVDSVGYVNVKPSDIIIEPVIFDTEDITDEVKETLKNVQCELEYEVNTDYDYM